MTVADVDNDEKAKELCERMARLRTALVNDVDQVSASARAMADWRYYVRRFPLATTAAMSAIGYLLVPHRGQPGADVAHPLKENKFALDGKPVAQTGGLFSTLVSIAGAAALRVATAFVTEKLKSSIYQATSSKVQKDEAPVRPHPR